MPGILFSSCLFVFLYNCRRKPKNWQSSRRTCKYFCHCTRPWAASSPETSTSRGSGTQGGPPTPLGSALCFRQTVLTAQSGCFYFFNHHPGKLCGRFLERCPQSERARPSDAFSCLPLCRSELTSLGKRTEGSTSPMSNVSLHRERHFHTCTAPGAGSSILQGLSSCRGSLRLLASCLQGLSLLSSIAGFPCGFKTE